MTFVEDELKAAFSRKETRTKVAEFLKKITDPLSYKCPMCGSEPGKSCWAFSETLTWDIFPHDERKDEVKNELLKLNEDKK